MLMSSSMIADRGTYIKKPVVGFGVVGMNTVTISSCSGIFVLISPRAVVETKAMAQLRGPGYSIRQALSKLFADSENTVSAICLAPV